MGLDLGELNEFLKASAIKKVGKLTPEDEELITSSSQLAFDCMDADKGGRISYEEFISYTLGPCAEHGAVSIFRREMQSRLKRNPDQLKNIIDQFQKWDANGDGFVTYEELADYLAEITAHTHD